MAYQEPRRQSSDVLLACEEVQYRSSQECTPRGLTPSTITTAGVVSDANVDTTFVGAYLVPEDGNMKDQVRQVKSVSAGTSATCDAGWVATTSCTSIRAWLPADVPVRVTTGGGTTTVTSSPHGSISGVGNDYWNDKGYYLIGAGGTNAGKASKVTDFATSGGVFTVGTAFTSDSAGDLLWLRKRVRSEGAPVIEVNRGSIARPEVGFADAAPAVQINRTGSVSFEMAVKGVTTAAANSVQAVRPIDICDFLSSVMTEDRDTGTTATANSATVIDVGAGSNLSVGGFILLNTNEVAQVRAISSNAVTVGTGHHTTGDLTAGSTAYASCWYQRKSTDFRTFTFDHFKGGLFRQVMHGCMPTISLSVSRDNLVKFAFAYTAGEAFEYTLTTPVSPTAAMPIGLVDTTAPFDTKGSRTLLNGTRVLLDKLTVNFGLAPVMRPSLSGPNQSDGMTMTLQPISGSFSVLADEDDRASFEDIVDLMNRRASVDFLYQHGSAPKNTFALAIPAMQFTGAPQSYEEGQAVYNIPWTAILPQTVPGNSFDSALPALSFGWM